MPQFRKRRPRRRGLDSSCRCAFRQSVLLGGDLPLASGRGAYVLEVPSLGARCDSPAASAMSARNSSSPERLAAEVRTGLG